MLYRAQMDGNAPDAFLFVADAQAISAGVAAARAFIARHDLGDDPAARLAIVVEELIANLIEHGDTAGTSLKLSLTRVEGGAMLDLTDAGIRFDPRDAVATDVSPERGGGAGLALVMAWSEVRSYVSIAGVNRLTLFVRFPETR